MSVFAAVVFAALLSIGYLVGAELGRGGVTRAALFTVAWMALVPMVVVLRFIPGARRLTLTERGVVVERSGKSWNILWRSVAFISDTSDYVLVGHRHVNFLVIPRAAFSSDDERRRF